MAEFDKSWFLKTACPIGLLIDVDGRVLFRVCAQVYTTCHLVTCRHSVNLCPAFLVAVTYAQLVVVNWTCPVSVCPRTFAYACPTSWNSLVLVVALLLRPL